MKILLIGNFVTGLNCNVWHALADRLEAAGYGIIRVSSYVNPIRRLTNMLSTIWLYRHEYKVAQIDVFSGRAFLWAEWSALLLHILGKPFILTLHGGNLPVFAKQHSGRVKRLLTRAAAVTTPSRYLLEAFQSVRSDLRLIPNPLEVGRYPFRLRSRPQPNLVWLRAFHHIYQPELAPRVLAVLRKEFPDARLVMVGPDKGDGSRRAAESCAVALGVQQHVEFTGPVPKSEVPLRLGRGDIFLNTTTIDNTPVSIMEAMACGLCIVSTNVGGIPFLLEDEYDALLVPPNDPQAMTAAVRRILTEPGLAARLSANARRKAEQFDWQHILPQWEALLNGIL